MFWLGLTILGVLVTFITVFLVASFLVMVKAIGDVDREDFE